jgi:hypothetical protein
VNESDGNAKGMQNLKDPVVATEAGSIVLGVAIA